MFIIKWDDNDIMGDKVKRGCTRRPRWLINGFRQAVLDSSLLDVPVERYPFTWFKSLGTPRAVEEWLDRALANNAWFNLFPYANLENLVASTSDHYPILLNRSPISRPHLRHRNFCYENAWHIEPGFRELVTDSWHMYEHENIIPKLASCVEDVSSWSKDHCRKLKIDIAYCRCEMHNIWLNGAGDSQTQLLEARKRMNRLLAQDDAYWRQRAKAHWYRDGDCNTKFFHASAKIISLEDDEGNKVTNDQGMREIEKIIFLSFFSKRLVLLPLF